MSEKNLKILGWIGTLLSVIMYVSYVLVQGLLLLILASLES